jgi:8-oxo-dGTP pyrophosphatase MutT (NUDIX family)
MVKLIYGNRIGKNTNLRVSATSLIFDEDRVNVLLIRRSDNGRWSLPGGGMDPGESAEETCVRETIEETGLVVRVIRLVGIYTSPDVIIEYEDGNRWQSVGFNFEAVVTGGELSRKEETVNLGYFPINSLEDLDLMENQMERILDAAKNLPAAIIK